MAGAQTGTGKTAAFVLPLLEQLLQHPTSDGPAPFAPWCWCRPASWRCRLPRASHATPEAPTSPARWSTAGEHRRTGGGAERRVDILIATPGRLLDHLRQGALTLAELRHLVFDEADRMLDMGFMDEIKALLKQIPADRQTLLFSATCDDNLFALCKVLLRDPALVEMAPRNTTAAEVEQRVYAVDSDRKVALVQHMLTVKGWAPALIFSRTRQGPTNWPSSLARGINALAFHGDLSQSARENVLLAFRAGTLQALVATDVAARGLDISDLNHVINLEFPISPRITSTASGAPAAPATRARITLFSPEDARCWKSRSCARYPSAPAVVPGL